MKKRKKLGRKLLGVLLTLAMVFSTLTGIVPGMSLTAQAASTELTAGTTTWENGDYVVPAGGLTISGHITVNGTVNLTLPAGTTLTANTGITLSDDATLNVSGEGAMTVNGTNNSTASTVAGTGTLVLTSGTLTAKGGNGQGIGDRQDNQTGANGGTAINGSVNMNGGTLTATGGNGGSVGSSCWDCKGGNGDAAISGNLTVNGGTMTATNGTAGSLGSRPINSKAGTAGASIGGKLTLGKNVTLYDGLGAVLDDNNSSSREYTGDRNQILRAVYEVTPAVIQITHTPAEAEGTVSMTYGDSNSELKSGETSLGDVKGKTVTLNITPKTGYRVKSVTVEKPAATTTTLDNTTTAWRDGTYAVPAGGLTYSDAITVAGDVTLVLTDGETLTLNKGIALAEGATLTVQGGGTMNVNGTNSSTASTVAGTGTLVLTGGTLTAKGGDGQGFSDSGAERNGAAGGVAINGNVTVEGGTLTATGGNGGSIAYGGTAGGENHGGNGGAAISGSLTINGGTVTTTNGSNGTNSTYSWMGNSAGSGGKAVAGTVTDNTETGGAGNESNPEETATIIEAEKQTDGSWQFTMPDYSVTLNIKYEEGADKTALNDAITAAETLYDSIKDNNDYTEVANTLKTAIDAAYDVADSETADQDAIDAATTAITDAKTNAEAAKKDVDDTNAANPVITWINALPAADDVTTANKEAIEAARAAYDDLTDDQKKKVDATVLAKLTDAEAALQDAIDTETAGAATDTINALPDADKVTTADKDAIEAARAAYDDLTDDQKKKVSDDTLKKLTDAEDALKAAGVSDTINALPAADEVTTADKEAIEAARKAYDDLSDEQKEYVSPETLKKLEDAESALAVAAVNEAIDALPAADKVTTANKEAIEAARKAYDALTDEEKEKIAPETLKKLTDAESALAVAAVKEAINALPDPSEITTEDADTVEEAKEAYDNLTDEQKEKITEAEKDKLDAAEQALKDAAVFEAEAMIGDLPVARDVTAEDEEAIKAASDAYDALDESQKAMVKTTLKNKLAADKVALAIAMLPAEEEVKAEDKDAIDAARKAYESLTPAQKGSIGDAAKEKLEAAEEKLVVLQAISEVSAKTGAEAGYTGKPVQLVNGPTTELPEGYTMKYAVTTEKVAPMDAGLYSEDIPAETAMGTYYVWVIAEGDEGRVNVGPEMVEAKIGLPFVDVTEGKYYYDGIAWAINQEPAITTGVDDTHYAPKEACTRGQAVTFLWRMAGCPEPTISNPFTDVTAGKYYYKAVLWAYEKGITTGTSDTEFSPKADCNRGQFITFLWRMAGEPEVSGVENPFTDVKDGKYYTQAVLWAYANDITTGTDDTHFSPKAIVNRGQAITFIYRFRSRMQ